MAREFVVRPALEDDAEAVSGVIAATMRKSNIRDYSSEKIEALVAGSGVDRMRGMIGEGAFFVAEEQGAIVGISGLVEDTLRRFFVLPSAQRRGIGGDLLIAVEKTVLANRLPVLRVNASLTSVGFYERHGFTAAGEALHKGIRFVKMYKNF